MKFASFSAWQILTSKGVKTQWHEYLRKLGIDDSPKMSKADIKREAELSIKKAEKLLKEAAKKQAEARKQAEKNMDEVAKVLKDGKTLI